MPKHVLVKLEQELKDIKQALLVDIPQEIARASGQGVLSENSEYEQAIA
jgi:transcription elongation GreA/GreB family factor